MASIGKKIISAFVEVEDKKENVLPREESVERAEDRVDDGTAPTGGPVDDRFARHFDKLLSLANIPGPDYYEFARMIAVMQGIPDDAARYNAAYAGLQVQGLNKQRLAGHCRRVSAGADDRCRAIPGDRRCFVPGEGAEQGGGGRRKSGYESRHCRRRSCNYSSRSATLQEEIRSSKEKLTGGTSAYTAESQATPAGDPA